MVNDNSNEVMTLAIADDMSMMSATTPKDKMNLSSLMIREDSTMNSVDHRMAMETENNEIVILPIHHTPRPSALYH